MRIIDPVTPRVLAVMGARLARLPMGQHPALFINAGLEGYRNYTFGGRAGPSVNVSHLFHELAHAAQFGPDEFRTRAGSHGYSFRVPRLYIAGRFCDEPLTMQASAREAETFAYQLHLMKAAGFRASPQSFFMEATGALKYMHDWYYVPGKSEEARQKTLVRKMNAYYQRIKQDDALGRLDAWLDKSLSRLKRKGKELYSDTSCSPRYALGKDAKLYEIPAGQVFL